MRRSDIILGAGITGLSLGCTSGWPVYEAGNHPGGICASYYMDPASGDTANVRADHENDYRFEVGGGHWIFGIDERTKIDFEEYSPLRSYRRNSAVYFPKDRTYFPYPIQNHLNAFPRDVAETVFEEIRALRPMRYRTMNDWLKGTFGETLFSVFFGPFNHLYTAGLSSSIRPQDEYKTPLDLDHIRRGMIEGLGETGYNSFFFYPQSGLGSIFEKMSERCAVRYRKRAVKIDADRKTVWFSDGDRVTYDRLISTIPLNRLLDLTGLSVTEPSDPYTSVLVLNVGGERGPAVPDYHWLYVPASANGFHRVGFYSNIDRDFLPRSERETGKCVSMYIEKAYHGGAKPGAEEIGSVTKGIIGELQEWNFLGQPSVVDATWIDVAYTWSYPDSIWKETARDLLRSYGIHSIGRYGGWHFQGIAESVREGRDFYETVSV